MADPKCKAHLGRLPRNCTKVMLEEFLRSHGFGHFLEVDYKDGSIFGFAIFSDQRATLEAVQRLNVSIE